ncbi:MAG: hypothetical protein IJW46_05010 [Clostridia bacterium]|nr:hypothetical protein [Clostridia bacterium]
MKIDRDKVASLDEKALHDMIYQVVRAMGFSKERAEKMAANAPAMRLMLMKASDRDLERIVAAVGEKKAKELLSGVEKRDSGEG